MKLNQANDHAMSLREFCKLITLTGYIYFVLTMGLLMCILWYGVLTKYGLASLAGNEIGLSEMLQKGLVYFSLTLPIIVSVIGIIFLCIQKYTHKIACLSIVGAMVFLIGNLQIGMGALRYDPNFKKNDMEMQFQNSRGETVFAHFLGEYKKGMVLQILGEPKPRFLYFRDIGTINYKPGGFLG